MVQHPAPRGRVGDGRQRQPEGHRAVPHPRFAQRPPSSVPARAAVRREVRGRERLSVDRAGPDRGGEGGRVGCLRLGRRGGRGQLSDPQRFRGTGGVGLARVLRRVRGDARGSDLGYAAGRERARRRIRRGAGRPGVAPRGSRLGASSLHVRRRGLVLYGQPRRVPLPEADGQRDDRGVHRGPFGRAVRRLGRRLRGSPLHGLRGAPRGRDLPLPLPAVGQSAPGLPPIPRLRRGQRRHRGPFELPRRGALGRGHDSRVVHDPVLSADLSVQRSPGDRTRKSGQAGVLRDPRTERRFREPRGVPGGQLVFLRAARRQLWTRTDAGARVPHPAARRLAGARH